MPARAVTLGVVLAVILAPIAGAGEVLAPGQPVEAIAPPHDAKQHALIVEAGTTLTVSVTGQGSSDLDVFIYDDFGNLLASSTDISDQCALTISPSRPGVVRIEVRNGGGNENAYTVRVS